MELVDEKKKTAAEYIVIEGIEPDEIYAALTVPPDTGHGDYALPCFRYAKRFGKSPAEVAELLKADILSRDNPFASVEAINGYLNLKFDRAELAKTTLEKILREGASYGSSEMGKGKTVCIDYSSINIAKPFHIGHLSTTAIGGALYKIYAKLGFDVVGINHLGDWGTQFGKLIVAFKRWGNMDALLEGGVKYLNTLYVRYHAEAESEPSMDDEARRWFKRIEDGDAEALELFRVFKEITLEEVKKIYDRLDITFDSYNGEAFYNDKMAPVIERLERQNLISVSDGAKVVDLKDYDMPPCLLVKADGATLYATRDLAAAFYRKNTYDFYKSLYVVAYQQNLHFKQVFKVIEMMGEPWYKDLVHVAFGMVSLEDGTMSTRKGHVVWLEEVLNKAVEKSREIILAKNENLADIDKTSELVGVGAVLFFALSNSRIKDIVFAYDKVLNFDGETGPYVQYTNARCLSVLRKAAGADLTAPFTATELKGLENRESEELIALLTRFGKIISDAADKYEPSLLTRYLVDLSQAYNKFYLENRILNAEPEFVRARVALTASVSTVLSEGLRLLGVGVPGEM